MYKTALIDLDKLNENVVFWDICPGRSGCQ